MFADAKHAGSPEGHGGMQLVSPEAKVLTTLTLPATKHKAQAIDNIISRLFTKGIKEKHSEDRDLKQLNPHGGWKIILMVPENEKEWTKNLKKVGEWIVSFDYPQPTIFSDWRICGSNTTNLYLCAIDRNAALQNGYSKLDWSQVLSYEIAKIEGQPMKLSEYISQKGYYQAALTNFDGNLASDKVTADNLCRAISSDMVGLGLNAEDSKIVVWAVINGMPRSKKLHTYAYANANACKEALDLKERYRAKALPTKKVSIKDD
jgi:hypothetical protein